MPIPQAPDTTFALDPLDSETCQVSFPVVAKIDAAQPIDFFRLVQPKYPHFSVKPPGTKPILAIPSVPQIVVEEPGANSQSWLFDSADRRWTLRLAKNMLSLTLRGSEAWDDLKGRFSEAVEAVAQTYRPALYNHVCVRQRYIVRRSMIGLGNQSWGELVEPWVIGALGNAQLAADLGQAHSRYLFKLPDTMGSLEGNYVLAEEMPFREMILVLDTHSYTNQRTAQNTIPRTLDELHGHSRNLFRASLRDRLRTALAVGTGSDPG